MPKGDKKKTLDVMRKDAQSFLSSYIQSPKYVERLKKQGYENPKQVVADRLKSMMQTRVINNPYVATEYHGYKNPNDRFITYNPDNVSGYKDQTGVLVHEYSHSAGALEQGQDKNINLNLNKRDSLELMKRNKLKDVTWESLGNMPVQEKVYLLHDKKPSENKSYIDALRYMMKRDGLYDAGRQDFNKETLEKAKKKYKDEAQIKFLLNNYKDSDLIWLMNNIAKTNSSNSSSLA